MRNLIICFVFVGFIRCSEKDNTKLVVTRDKSGRITSEVPYLNDTLKHGLVKYYYENGDIKNEVEYSYGKREGWRKFYEPGKVLKSRIHFKDGIRDGQSYRYYDNNKLESFSYWMKGEQYGSIYFYYPSGQIEKYRCNDFFGNVVYVIQWDEKGSKTREEGVVFSPEFHVIGIDSTNTARVSQEVTIEITVAEPPGTKTTIWMGELVSGEKIEGLEKLAIENNTAIYKRTFTQPGKYRLVTSGEIKSEDGILLNEYSVTKDFIVK
jgi:hypothetical protein